MTIQLIKSYYYLTKPGIIYGNLLTCAAGFFLAAKGNINFFLFIATLVGTALIIGSACVFNNYIDRGIDKKMARTQKRALVTGKISGQQALIFASILGILGTSILFFYTNLLTTIVGLLGLIFYVIIYGYAKRKSDLGTLVGSIPGATPPLAGYVAVTNQFDIAAILLFLILVVWQMPHFYAIAVYRLTDYAAAHIPVLPRTQGLFITKMHMAFYAFAFLIMIVLLTIFGYIGYVTMAILITIGGYWLFLCIKGFSTTDNTKWAKHVFRFSLLILLAFSLLLSIDVFLP